MRAQGEGHLAASLVFVSDTPPTTIVRALAPFLNGTNLPAFDQVFVTTFTGDHDWQDLELELNMVRPMTIVTLGEGVTYSFLGLVDFDRSHGHPVAIGDLVIFPMHVAVPSGPGYVPFACDMLQLSRYFHQLRMPSPSVYSVAPTIIKAPKAISLKPKPKLKDAQPRLWTDS